jgi:ELWxxDGT repeat protein
MIIGKAATLLQHRLAILLILLCVAATAPFAAPAHALDQPGLVRDIAAGPASSDPRMLATLGDFLLFEAYDANAGWQLWRSDGSPTGTNLVVDLSPYVEDSRYNLTRPIAEFNGFFYFAVDGYDGLRLWKTDGSSAGTTTVGTVHPAGPDDIARLVPGLVFANKLYFLVNSFGGSGEHSTLWFTDGSDAGTQPLTYPGSANDLVTDLVVVGDGLFFSAIDTEWFKGANRSALYRSDGSAAGTHKLLDVPQAQIRDPIAYAGQLLFSAYTSQHGQELWRSDGTVAGTRMLKDVTPGRDGVVDDLRTVGGVVLFTAGNYPEQDLWRSDGTAAGTFRLQDFVYGDLGGWFLSYGTLGADGNYYFAADNGTQGRELWRSDGTSAGTTLVKDTIPGADSSGITSIVASGNLLYFLVGEYLSDFTLWRSDGSPEGTFPLQAIGTLPGFVSFGLLTSLGDGVTFVVGNRDNLQIWSSMGTPESTAPLRDPTSARPLLLSPAFPYDTNGLLFLGKVGTSLLFNASDSQTGFELWRFGALTNGRVTAGLLALYDFEEGQGLVIHDSSGVGRPLDLRVARSFTQRWVAGGLRLRGQSVLRSRGSAGKLISAAKASNALTIEAWITPDDVRQFSARLISISPNPTTRNITLSQGSFQQQDTTMIGLRLRTTTTASDGAAWTSASGALTPTLTHLVVTLAPNGAVRIYLNGALALSGTTTGTFAQWNDRYPLLLGNEAVGGRGWRGTYYLVAFYDRALSASEVGQNFRAGP